MKLKLILLAGVLSLTILALFPGHGLAITDRLPNPAQFNGSGSYVPDMKLEVATGIAGAGGLQATVSDVMVYMNTLTSVNITGGNQSCNEDSNTDLPTTFVFRYLDNNNSWQTFYRVDSSSLPCGTTTIGLRTYNPANYLHSAYGNKKFMKVNIIATADASLVGKAITTNAFSLSLTTSYPNNFISYWGAPTSGDKFAMQDRNKLAPACSTPNGSSYYCPPTTFNLEFGSDCTVTQANTWAQLRWFDDDAGSLEPAAGIQIDLYDETVPGRVPLYTDTSASTQVYNAKFGPNVPGNAWYRTQPNHKYHWTWSNVSRPNGIQFDLPYEAINHEVDCKPPTGTVSSACAAGKLVGYAIDNDKPSAQLSVAGSIVPGGSIGQVTANQAGAAPYSGHYYSLTIPPRYFDGAPHETHLDIYGVNPNGTIYGSPYELPQTANGNFTFTCPPKTSDLCLNIPGIQTTVTPPLVRDDAGNCNAPSPTYICSNLGPGITTLPSGYAIDPADQTCYIPVCPNVPGGPYRTPPTPYQDVGGVCVIDVCNNIGGIQLSPPPNMTAQPDGRCTNAVACGSMTTSGALVRGQTFYIAVSVTYAGVLTPYRPADALAVSVNNGVYNNGDVDFSASNGTVQSASIPITTGTGTYQTDWNLSGQSITGSANCSAQFTVDSCSNVAGIQATDPAGMILNANGTCSDIPSCAGIVTSGLLESGIGFNVTVRVNYTGLLNPSRPADNLSVSFSGGIPGNGNVIFTETSPGVLVSDPVPVNAPLGDYTVQWVLSGADFAAPLVCPSSGTSTIKVGKRPYFRTYGGDIRSGGNFTKAGKCNAPDADQGSIIGQYVNSLGGAGTELANIALIRVSGVASADLRTVAPTEPNGLTFANTTNLPSGVVVSPPDVMGGYYSTTGYCAPDYYSDEQFELGTDPRIATDASNVVDISNSSTYKDGYQTILNNGGRIKIKANGGGGKMTVRHTFFVDGDVDIDKNITYPGNIDADPLNNPYLVIIVRGNIYIDPKVNNLAGLFIAQPKYNPDGTVKAGTGRIYTCRKFDDTPAYNSAQYTSPGSDGCLSKLTITGGFIAQRVIMQRTVAGLSGATLHETADSGNVSEVFQETPELYMGRPVFKQKPNLVDSIKSLPPIL